MSGEEFKRIWLPLSGRFYKVAYYLLENEQDAKDAVQDLYIRLWSRRTFLYEVAKPEAYGIRILKNLCIDKIRKVSSSTALELEKVENEVLSFEVSPVAALMDKDLLEKVLYCVDTLPAKQASILKMRVFDGLDYDEIAEKTGLSLINLRVVLSLARKSLRKKLGIKSL